jgi:parallel beta-helix repeat protein
MEKVLLKRATSEGILLLLLTSMLTVVFNIPPVKADETIYIRSDGSVDPPTAPIQRNEDVYLLTNDIHNSSIIVQRDNMTLDGNGHMLQWFQKYYGGIDLYIRKNITITNIVISGFLYGIRLDSSCNNKIINNTILGSNCGIMLVESSNNNILENNTLTNNDSAIEVSRSSNNTLLGNKVSNNVYGIFLYTSTYSTLRGNTMTANKYNFFVGFFFKEYYLHDIDTSNIVDGKPIYYWINRYNETVPMDAGCIVVVDSANITVKNLEIKNNWPGIALAYTVNSLIENVTVIECGDGISLDHCDSCLVTGNKITSSLGAGIGLTESIHSEVACNVILNTTGAGVWLEDTYMNTIICNEIAYTRGGYGFQEFDGGGILVDDSSFCNVIGNNVTMNKYGIVLGAMLSKHNLIIRNNIKMNEDGLILFEGKNNTIYHNNFIDNRLSQVCTYYGTKNNLDSGYPSGETFGAIMLASTL